MPEVLPDRLCLAQGEFQLARYPFSKKDLLRAWDAADEYLLNYLSDNLPDDKPLNILIINDSFGALTIPLSVSNNVTLWSDSYLSEQGVLVNFKKNMIPKKNFRFIESTANPDSLFDVVIMKLPKSNALLEDQLIRLLPFLSKETVFVAAAMAKNIHSSTLNYFENIIGETKTSLAVKKSRLVFCNTSQLIVDKKSPYPKCYQLENSTYDICNHANVFSREKLDIGTRFFMEYLPAGDKYKKIIDLGCGNGLLGLLSAERNPQATVVFSDESYMAIASARENFKNSGLQNKTEYYVMDGLESIDSDTANLVVNNPPFHQQHAIGDVVAWRMFQHSKRVLKRGGELWVIGNRHLAYHVKLKKLFGNCETIATNKKFIILKATKN